MIGIPRISICIVHWNARHHLEQCLQALRSGLDELSGEIIVVDNGSLPASTAGVDRDWPEVRWIWNGRNAGLAAGNNLAASHARGGYILFLNPDVIVHREALRALVALLDDYREAGCGSCVKRQPAKGSESVFRAYPTDEVRFWESARDMVVNAAATLFPEWRAVHRLKLRSAVALFDLGCLHEDRPFPVDMVWGACMIVRTAVFRSIGGFDESFFYGAEDKDLCLRIRKAGHTILFEPRVSVDHIKGASISLWSVRERESIKIFARLYLYRKYRGIGGLLKNALGEAGIHTLRSLLEAVRRIRYLQWNPPMHEEERADLFTGLAILCANTWRVLTRRGHPASSGRPFHL